MALIDDHGFDAALQHVHIIAGDTGTTAHNRNILPGPIGKPVRPLALQAKPRSILYLVHNAVVPKGRPLTVSVITFCRCSIQSVIANSMPCLMAAGMFSVGSGGDEVPA